MDFSPSPRAAELQAKLSAFMDEHVYPNERRFHEEIAENTAKGARWTPTRVIEDLKPKAKAAGLWNLFLPDKEHGAGLTNVEYAPLAELTGRVSWSPEVFNCSAPDTGNMEVLAQYGSQEQKRRWLAPLLAGDIRSAFAMTEPAVASSDATNIATSIRRDGGDYVIDGRKWWISGAGDPRCRVFIVMGKTDPSADAHRQQSMILVPAGTPGLEVVRPLPVYGFDDAPHGHCEVLLKGVRVPAENLLLGEGRGFEIAQGRLGPGRIHHCMRLIGLSERSLELMCRRLSSRVAFGKPIAAQSVWHERIAESRVAIDQARWLVLHAAWKMDQSGNKAARNEIAMIKVVAPQMACRVIDWAIQAHGGGGVSDDFPLAAAYSVARSLRIADGPDEVHRNSVAKNELGSTGFESQALIDEETTMDMELDRGIVATLSGVTTATITTLLLKKGLRNVWMRGTRPIRPGQPRLVGRAFTLRFVPAREDLATPESWSKPISTRGAIEAMPEGCIVVADARGVTDAGIFGDILCARMAKKKVAGLVTDGVVRDIQGVLGTGLPVWCQGAAAPPSVAGLTFVNWQEPIGCGGVAVFPGDVVVVDEDGAVLIPAALLDDLVAAAPEQERLEAWIMGEVERGVPLPGLYPPNAEAKARYDASKK